MSESNLPESSPVSESSSPQSESTSLSSEATSIDALLSKHFPNGIEAAPQEQTEVEEEITEEKPKKEDKFSKQFAALSRKEKEVREEKLALKAERERIAAERAEIDRVRSIAANRDVKALAAELGLSVNDFVEAFLDDVDAQSIKQADTKKESIDPAIQELRQQLEELKNEKLEKEKQALEAEAAAVIDGFKQHLKQTIDAAGDNYELIKSQDRYDDVFTLIETYHAQEGKLLSVEEAANWLESELEEEATKLLQLNKIKSKFGQQSPKAAHSKEESVSNSFTLTNTQASSQPTRTEGYLSKAESLDRLAAKLVMK